jgi:hypothetical protein
LLPATRPLLLVSDGTAATADLAAELSKRHATKVVILAAGAAAESTDNGGSSVDGSLYYTLTDINDEQVSMVVSNIEAAHGNIGGIVFQNTRCAGGRIDDTDDDGASQLKFAMLLAKFCSSSLRAGAEEVVTLTQGGRTFFFACVAPPVNEDRCGRIESLTGLCKTLGHEWSAEGVFCRAVVFESSAPYQAKVVADELGCADSTCREVRYDADTCDRYRLVDRSHGVNRTPKCTIVGSGTNNNNNDNNNDNTSETFVVSGGGRGIAPLIVAEMAKRIPNATFHLLGRLHCEESDPQWAAVVLDDNNLKGAAMKELKRLWKEEGGEKPTPKLVDRVVRSVAGSREVRRSLAKIRENGGRAFYHSCDANDQAAVTTLFKNLGPCVTGLLHAAGVLRDKRIEDKTTDDFDAVFGVKLTGLRNILAAHTAMGNPNLTRVVLFSSLAGFHGNPAQVRMPFLYNTPTPMLVIVFLYTHAL